MFGKRLEAARSAAAASTLALIRADRKSAPKKLKPLLAYIEGHLFDPGGLKVKTVLRECGVRDHKVQTLFHAVVGQSPRTYIEDCRLVVAALLLRDTALDFLTIAHLVGYRDAQALGQVFRRWCGLDLAEFRKRAKATKARLGESEINLHPIELRRKAFSGELGSERAEPLVARLHAIYKPEPKQERDACVQAVAVPFNPEIAAQALAEMTWRTIRDEPYEVQRATVLACYPSPALFHLLLKKSREAGRLDRRRGEQLAELALASLELCAPLLGDAYHDLEALGWAWLGNARRLNLDHARAEEAFVRAEAAWRVPREHPDLQVQAQILDLKAALRMFQRRFAEAVQLQDRAIDLFRTLDNSRLLVPALILRASISAYRDEPEAMIPDLREARKHLESCDDARLELTVCNNLAYGYAVTGEHEAAAELLPQVKVLCRESGSWLEWHQIQWVEGLLSQAQKDTAAAAQKFQEARAGFLELGEMDHAAVVALDEAILSAEQGRTKEVVELVTAALPAFEALRTQREAVAALRLLEKALAAEDLSLAVLREARAHLERLRLDPSRHRCRSYDLAG